MTEYIPYAVIQPSLNNIRAIATRDVFEYSHPTYEHYNWCCEQLGLEDQKVEHPKLVLTREQWVQIQNLMVAACEKYLQENNLEN